MEKPAEEWARAAAELEPLRLEFSIYEQSASRRLALVVVGLVIAPGALMSVIAALDDPAGGAFMAGVFGLLGLTVLGAQRILRTRPQRTGHALRHDHVGPNITSYDSVRATGDLFGVWDPDVPLRFLY